MAILIHRCKCGHPDIYHGGNRDRACEMACGCQQPSLNQDPEVIPTFDGLGKPVTTITKPGTRWIPGLTVCGCPLCEMRHSELDGAAA